MPPSRIRRGSPQRTPARTRRRIFAPLAVATDASLKLYFARVLIVVDAFAHAAAVHEELCESR